MGFLKLLAAGALGFVAYKSWQRYQAGPHAAPPRDDGARTPPHGDPILAGEHIDMAPSPRPAAQASRSFGEP
ncbi:hypothetical protein FZO89_07675 [Luteimonas viscosa]|uniref:Uncharacterized protein n=1 Tax=Luteimonas viscosa TaxID=1132694 RepID=A0A5D4XNC1_9GAMM|nr:hypothetical protein [Luteimonas viscosa]TYT26146.1 hypothetical protein FZO89_07675 [Luteimonas viscosa]